MGKPTASCFKIISCGTDSIDHDQFEASEIKGSSDKRRWSFRKRSPSHRLIVSETPSPNKDCTESANADLQTKSVSTLQEKASVLQLADEEPRSSASADSKLSEPITTKVNDSKTDLTVDEQEVLVIQTAIRAFLAQRALLKHKNVTILQAAVRGHLVRRHAVGTLRCVQAIVKMQALVRARHAYRLVEGSNISDKLDGKENLGKRAEVTHTSISKLLSNRFAQQLLESTPRTKSINIKCDPSKSDSAWKWLERWMSVSSGYQQSQGSELPADQQEIENIEYSRNLLETVQFETKSIISGRAVKESPLPSESDQNLMSYGADSIDLKSHKPTSPPSNSNLEQSQPQVVGETNSRDDTLDSIPAHLKDSDELQETEPTALPDKIDSEGDQNVHSVTRIYPEPPEPEDKMFIYGSRKASNPAFVAAQTKFEKLSSAAKSAKVSRSSNHEAEVESCADTVSYTTDHGFGARETALSENSMRVQVGGSECGTELSISSTLDSPDRYEAGAQEFEQELEASEDDIVYDKSNGCSHIGDDSMTIPRNDLLCFNADGGREDATDDANSEHIDVISPDVFHGEQKKENNIVKSSPEASARRHLTGPESQGTPSSQVSVNPKKIRSEKSGSNPKRRSSSTVLKFPSNPKTDSGITSSEQLTKDRRNGKQHSSFDSERTQHDDQEPRDSSSSNSLPSYMQATKSARAKAISNSSPRSSPDVQSKEAYIKKKHSHSGSNGRQGSARDGQSPSHAQRGAKENGTQSMQERKWQR
nr:PREDICTED: protein IQ-DOMAIN 32-like [Nicotiana tabacum]